MNTRKFSEALGNVGNSYIERAAGYGSKRGKRRRWVKWAMAAACLAVVLTILGLIVPFGSDMGVAVYAYGTNEEITSAGAVISTGTISDTGKMKGHPLMFYLSGKDIAAVRFSCKNEQIYFCDWTEQRDEYGNARNFTVAYGKDESEYYYLTIDWVPNSIIRELTDNRESSITTLPEEMREDIIVLEITFGNGENATKAIRVSLLDDGTFFAVFEDYEITDADTFVNRPDSQAIAREILYAQGEVPADSTQDENEESEEHSKMGNGEDGREDGREDSNMADSKEDSHDNNRIEDNKEDNMQDASEEDNSREDREASSNRLSSAEEDSNGISSAEDESVLSEAGATARAYYAGTVFEVVSMEVKSWTDDEIIFTVCVSRGGVIQEPDRSCTLQYSEGAWKVTNEGY